jgi:hypothetical protein
VEVGEVGDVSGDGGEVVVKGGCGEEAVDHGEGLACATVIVNGESGTHGSWMLEQQTSNIKHQSEAGIQSEWCLVHIENPFPHGPRLAPGGAGGEYTCMAFTRIDYFFWRIAS